MRSMRLFAPIALGFVFAMCTARADEKILSETEVVPQIESTLPNTDAVTAVMVHQCGAAVGIYATMPDGLMLVFDMRSPIPWNDQYTWFMKAKTHISVEAKCHVLPEWLAPPPKVKS